tara:strand:+ start:69253 stop:70584 length:1332 start_codon:yes stop_codon:yes gene_type:complete
MKFLKVNLVITTIFIVLLSVSFSLLNAYPLDGVTESGIQRLIGYANSQASERGAKLPPGALLSINDIKLSLGKTVELTDFDELTENQDLKLSLNSILKSRDPSYGAVVIDMSDPDNIIWAGVRPDIKQNAGSVGKLLIMSGFFNALAKGFPDISNRKEILKSTQVLAQNWVIRDSHTVPKFDPSIANNRFSTVIPNDTFSLAEWIDHMISPSANAAASVVWREAMLLEHFSSDYPVSLQTANDFFSTTPKKELTELSQRVINQPLEAANINTKNIQQGSFFTSTGKQKVPGLVSYATPRELARIIYRMEQGRLVDEWSSLEMKRFLYMTKRRYRYVYAPELHNAAVYFKSGSLYQCKPEENYVCGKYMGNAKNYMNSVAIVEWNNNENTRYLISLMSNVLKINSAWDHSRLAVAIDTAIRLRQGKVDVKESGSKEEILGSGQG